MNDVVGDREKGCCCNTPRSSRKYIFYFCQSLIEYLSQIVFKYCMHVNGFDKLQSNVLSPQFLQNFHTGCSYFQMEIVFMVLVLKRYFTLGISFDRIWVDNNKSGNKCKHTFENRKLFHGEQIKTFIKILNVEVVSCKCAMEKLCTQMRNVSFMSIS